MKFALILSIVINTLFGGYVINKKGGIDYLKNKIGYMGEIGKSQDYSDYYKAKKSIFEILPNDTNEIIFIGNSIIDYCDWYELFGNAHIKNRGIGGDIIIGVINRLDEIVESNPKKIFLMIGINDLGRNHSVEQILRNHNRLLLLIKEKSPKSKVFIQSMLPTDNRENLQNVDIIRINDGLKELAAKHQMTFINLFDVFKTDKNKLNTDYTIDGLHLNGEGYLIWKTAIDNYVNN